MFSNFYIRTNKEETRMSDIKVIKANATLNVRNKKRNTDVLHPSHWTKEQ